jgi:hypothetical protein
VNCGVAEGKIQPQLGPRSLKGARMSGDKGSLVRAANFNSAREAWPQPYGGCWRGEGEGAGEGEEHRGQHGGTRTRTRTRV